MKKIAILGGAGFIGRNLVEQLVRSPEKVDILVLDNLSAPGVGVGDHWNSENVSLEVKELGQFRPLQSLIDYQPDQVFHLAANSDIQAGVTNPQKEMNDTLLTTISLIETCRAGLRCPITFSSSSAVFGRSTVPLKVDSNKRPESLYGYMKLASEELLIEAATAGLIPKLSIFRFPNVTGKFQTHGVVRDLVKKANYSRTFLEVLGDGSQLKPYVLASELSKVMLLSNEEGQALVQTIHVFPPDRISVREIAEIVVEKSGRELKIIFGENEFGWIGDVPSYEFDNSVTTTSIPIEMTSRSAILESVILEFARIRGA